MKNLTKEFNSFFSWKLPQNLLDGHNMSYIAFKASRLELEGVRSLGHVYFLCPNNVMMLCLSITNVSKQSMLGIPSNGKILVQSNGFGVSTLDLDIFKQVLIWFVIQDVCCELLRSGEKNNDIITSFVL